MRINSYWLGTLTQHKMTYAAKCTATLSGPTEKKASRSTEQILLVENSDKVLANSMDQYGTVCRNPFCRIRQSIPTLPILPNFYSANWASEFGRVGIEIRQSGQSSCLHLQKQIFESENIMWGISDVCTLALTVAKTSSITIVSRSPFPLGFCSCSTSLSKMGT